MPSGDDDVGALAGMPELGSLWFVEFIVTLRRSTWDLLPTPST
jgi:hypothetical protein